MIVSRRIAPPKRRRGGLRFTFAFAFTTVMVVTGGFGVFPDNPVTLGLQQVIAENIPAGFLQPFNAYMEVISAPTIQPDSAPVSRADSSLDPVGELVQFFPTDDAGSPALSQETAIFETAFAILAETQTQIAYTLTAEASITPTMTITGTVSPTSSPTFTSTPTVTPAPVYYYPTNTPLPPAPPQATATFTATPIPPIVLYAGASSTGNIGLRTSADSLCALNLPAGYTRFRAFIAYSDSDSIANMPGNYLIPTNVQIESPNGTFLAMDWADLMDGFIEQDLNAAGLGGSRWWSGAEDGSGTHIDFATSDCNEWTSNSAADGGNAGYMNTFDSTWLNPGSTSCDQSLVILCVAY